MSETTKKVVFRLELDPTGNVASGLNKIGDAAGNAVQNVSKLQSEMKKAAGGGGGGNFLGSAASRDQLVLQAMRFRDFSKNGLSAADLTKMTDQQLFDFTQNKGKAPAAAPTSLLGRLGADAKASGLSLWNKSGLGGLGNAGGMLAVAASALAANEGWNQAGVVAHQGGSAGEQTRAYANSNFVTRNALGVVDSIRGRDAGFAKADYDAKVKQVEQEGKARAQAEQDRIRMERLELEARRSVLGGDRRYVAPGAFDRRTVAGERGFREDASTLGARQGVVDAEKEAGVLANLLRGQEQLRTEFRGRLAQADQQAAGFREQGRSTGGVDKSVALDNEGRGNQAALKAIETLQNLERQMEQTRERSVQALAQVGRARIAAGEATLGVLEGREADAAGTARRLGQMNRVQFGSAKRAAEMIEQFGIENVPPQVAELARPLIGQHIDKLEEQRGAAYQDQNKDFFGRFDEHKFGVNDVRKEIDNLRAMVAGMEEALKRGVADEAAAKRQGQEMGKVLLGLKSKEAEIMVREAQRAVEQANVRGK